MTFKQRLARFADELEERRLYIKHCSIETCAWGPTCDNVLNYLRSHTRAGTRRIIELGSGTGGLVQKIIASDRLAPDGLYVSVELNSDFVKYQRDHVDDSRVRIVQARAEELKDIAAQYLGPNEQFDHAYSSLPYSVLKTSGLILQQIRAVLQQDGISDTHIFRDVTGLQRQVFAEARIMKKVYGQLVPLLPYLIQRATGYAQPQMNGHPRAVPAKKIPKFYRPGLWRRTR